MRANPAYRKFGSIVLYAEQGKTTVFSSGRKFENGGGGVDFQSILILFI